MRTLIFGNGYLGNEYLNSGIFENAKISDKNISMFEAIKRDIDANEPDLIINCAGKTNLEWCRDNKLEAIFSNIVGPLNLLSIARKKNIYLVHIGSGCIFEGVGSDGAGFTEEDEPNPQCFYAHTKAIADKLLIAEPYDKILVLRIRQPISEKPHSRNLISKIINYDKLITSPNSMTYLSDLILATKFLLDKKQNGIFNICNQETISPYEIAILAKGVLNLNKSFEAILKEELDGLDKNSGREKRVDAMMNIDKLTKAGFQMPKIKERIIEALKNYK